MTNRTYTENPAYAAKHCYWLNCPIPATKGVPTDGELVFPIAQEVRTRDVCDQHFEYWCNGVPYGVLFEYIELKSMKIIPSRRNYTVRHGAEHAK